MTKYWRTFILISIIGLTVSCKKGENDPFLSLQSRKARMHGDWDMSSYEYKEKTEQSNGDYTEIAESYQYNLITRVQKDYTESNNLVTYDTTVIMVDHIKFNFDKKGTWLKEYFTTTISTNLQQDGTNYIYDTTVTVSQIIETGDWSFLGAVQDEFKDKERMIMNVLDQQTIQQETNYHTVISLGDTLSYVEDNGQTSESSTYYSGEKSCTIEIDQLKKKEMIFIEKRRNSGSTTITPYQGVPTTLENANFYSDSKLTLKRN